MKKSVFSLGLLAILATSLSAVSSVDASNIGDPQKKGCTDGQTLASNFVKIQGHTLTVEMRSSRKCGAKWVKAYIPRGTNLYLKDSSGRRYVNYTAQVSGWNFSDMENGKQQFQACAKHPSDPRELCTNFR